MVFEWKLTGIIPVDAQTAGEELDRIYSANGSLTAANIVEASRPESAPLHCCFEWDDTIAAEKYRQSQAGDIIRNITVAVSDKEEQAKVRAFVSVRNEYKPIHIVLTDEEQTAELLMMALRELKAFEAKYSTLKALRPVMTAIQEVTQKGAA